jgi:exosortase A-associated hydrolase 1
LGNALRQIVAIPCEQSTLLATLDGPADARIGWLFVIGGTQTRVGPHRLYERLALRMAEAGHAVIRFDRRGVGDSEGNDPGYFDSGPEMGAALATLRAHFPQIATILGFGLCDGAAAIALAAPALSGAVLANPWVVEPADDLPPAAAIRQHYRKRLLDPHAWARLLRGGINLGRLWRGLRRAGATENDGLARRVITGMPAPGRVVLAEGDGTAQAFADAWRRFGPLAPRVTVTRVATASHSFADAPAFEALAQALLDHSAATASSASKSASAR